MSLESRTYTLAVVVEPAEEAWHAYCPTLLDYGVATWGVTREDALGISVSWWGWSSSIWPRRDIVPDHTR